MSNTHSQMCWYPHHYVMLTPDSEVRPCCRYVHADDSPLAKWDQSKDLQEFYSQKPFSQIRTNFASGAQNPGCQKCSMEESMGLKSMRQKSLFHYSQDSYSGVDLRGLEIAIGRICNLKCRSCDSRYSTKWEAEDLKRGKSPTGFPLEMSLEKISDATLSRLRELKITGGEPLMHPQFEKFLSRMVQNKSAEQIHLELFSNCTIPPSPEIVALMKQFRKITISLSIDAFGDKNSYLRHPSKWSDVVEAWEAWTTISTQSNAKVAIALTVSIFNIIDQFELIDWVYSQNPQTQIMFQIAQSPSHLNVALYPLSVKKALANTFKKHLQSKNHWTEKWLADLADIEKMLLNKTQTQENILNQFFEETLALDQIRNENFAKTFPQLHEILTQSETVDA